MCGACFIIICSSSVLLLVAREDCGPLLWHFLGGLIYVHLQERVYVFTAIVQVIYHH